jgi:hypothetical protein
MHRFFFTALMLLLLWQVPSHAAVLTVTNTSDNGPGSLRQAITDANASAGVADTINFSIGSGAQTITALSALPDITDTLTIDGTSQPGFTGTPLVILEPGPDLTNADGLRLTAQHCTIKALVVNGFSIGIEIAESGAGNNRVQGCYLGIDADGATAGGTGVGIYIKDGTGGNIIGGTQAAARNIIANSVQIDYVGNNTVQGNFIGTNATGTMAIGNGSVIGILMSSGNVIGGAQAGARNVIAGDIQVDFADATAIQGNYIGTDAVGTAAIGNGAISIQGGNNNIIGGTQAADRNVITGGIQIEVLSTGNTIQGNYIGTDASGSVALGNSSGIFLGENVTNTLIGGTQAGARNVISGNREHGIWIQSTSDNVIQGNYIGTNAAGTAALANGGNGVHIADVAVGDENSYGNFSRRNKVGGTVAGARNVISGNVGHGVYIENMFLENAEQDSNVIQGNYIGTNAAGTAAIGNGGNGVMLNHLTEHTVGGTEAGARNVISGNAGDGIHLSRCDFGLQVQGNYIGTNATATGAIGNGGDGIVFESAGGTIGGATAEARNIISGNAANGVHILNGESFNNSGTTVQGNYIGTNGAGTGNVGNRGDGIRLTDTYGIRIGGIGGGEGNRIAFNNGNGVNVVFSSLPGGGSPIRGNAIFANGKLGIDLNNDGVSPNDEGPSAPSDWPQDYPVITGVTQGASTTTLTGTFKSGANQTYILDFYRNTALDPSGFGEGEFYVGSTSVLTDADGAATFSFTFAGTYPGNFFAATASSMSFSSAAETSEFGPTWLTISGRIGTSDGTGVAGATVTRSGGPAVATSASTTVQTDASGNYVLTRVIPGSYTVSATGSGYTFAPSSFTNPVEAGRSGIDFIATAVPTGSYNVSGRVSNHLGAGMVGIIMRLNGTNRQVQTDNNGNYTFSGVPTGSYSVAPVNTPALAGVVFTPNQRWFTVSGGHVYNQNFIAAFTVNGRVSNHSGVGIPNVLVQLTDGTSVRGLYTDAYGYYSFSQVRSGSYTVGPVLTPAMSGTSFTPTSRSLTVDRSNIYNQNFIGMFSISGNITTSSGAALENVLVRLSDGNTSTTVRTDAQGNYRFSNVRSGTYSVTPSLAGRTFTPASRGSIVVSTRSILNQNFTASN